MIIQIYSDSDLKKDGQFKKKNNISTTSKKTFFEYLQDNNLTIKSQYIDAYGNISNGKYFKCFYNNLIIGTSKVVEEFNNFNKLKTDRYIKDIILNKL